MTVRKANITTAWVSANFSLAIVLSVRYDLQQGQGAHLEGLNHKTLYMLEPSILRYDRAEHEEIHWTCGSHIACSGIQIGSSFTTSTVFEMPAWSIHLQYYRVLGLWTSNHPPMTDSALWTRAAAHVGFCSGYTWSVWISSSTCWQRDALARASEPLTTTMAYPDPSFSSVNS